jgi:hypothetical protein
MKVVIIGLEQHMSYEIIGIVGSMAVAALWFANRQYLRPVSVWLYVRLGLLLIVAIQAGMSPLAPRARPPIGWLALLVIFGVCTLSMPLLIGLQRINPSTAKVWTRPSWTVNPLTFRDPIQFFYFGAFVSITGGTVELIRIASTSIPFYVEALVPVAMGGGVLIGIKITLVLFASKFELRDV